MQTRIGTCSICGGDVVGFYGPWHGTSPLPASKCIHCGAVIKEDVIEMVKPKVVENE